jgi:hypothetical protein
MPLDGLNPQAGLTPGPDGNFYGTTRAGGSAILVKFSPHPEGTLTRMFAFNGANGAFPQSTLTPRRTGFTAPPHPAAAQTPREPSFDFPPTEH